MLKKTMAVVSALVVSVAFIMTGCANPGNAGEDSVEEKDLVKVGMVTDSGTIDDKSFNQGTWEGIKAYEEDKKTITTKYQQPEGEAKTDYINAITDLADNGYEIIVTPGYKFETAIYEAQDTFKDTTFIFIDGMPHDEDFKDFKIGENVVSVFFNEHESGFLAGVAAALSSETGKLGFIGGMEIPPVQKFGWGFKAGVKYANDIYGTNAEVAQYIYEGSFNNVSAGQQFASNMFDEGIDVIFAAAGGVGVGVMNETKGRASKGEEVYIVGVDVDQYEQGIYDEENNKSCVLTSATKKLDIATYDYIDAKLKGEFPGGQEIRMGLAEKAVGLPENNPNLSEDIMSKVKEVEQALLDGTVTAPATAEEINTFLGEDFVQVTE